MHAVQSINSGRSEKLNICTFRCLKSIASFLESVLRTTMRWAVSGAFPSGKHTTACSPQIRETSAEDRISPKYKLVRPMSLWGSLTEHRGRVTEKSNGDPKTATSY